MSKQVAKTTPVSDGVTFARLVEQIGQTHEILRQNAVRSVNRALVVRNWLVGHYIVEFEQHGADRAAYGDRLFRELATRLTRPGTKGFSETTLRLCRQFYRTHTIHQAVSDESASPNSQTLSADLQPDIVARFAIHQTLSDELNRRFSLSWSHYTFLMQISDPHERSFYEIEAARENWSIRELKRQFNSSLYERLALSRDKNKVRQLSGKGQVVAAPADAIKEPVVLEFLGLKEHPAYSESELEQAIIDRLEHFLLELGKGFLFQARQYRLTFDDKHFWVDLVFYNRLLRCFVLVDLKIGELTHQDLGQMQMYVNYTDRHVKTADENPTVGIVLCKTKSDAVVEMTLPKGRQTIFASRYQLYLPSKAELRAQLDGSKSGRKR